MYISLKEGGGEEEKWRLETGSGLCNTNPCMHFDSYLESVTKTTFQTFTTFTIHLLIHGYECLSNLNLKLFI